MADPADMQLAIDRELIRTLLAQYTVNGDRGRVAQLAACFADDGVLEFPGGAGIGPSGIVAALRQGPADPRRTFVRHHTTNPLIEIDGPTARVRSYFTVFSNNGPDHAGTYDDRLIRTDLGWRFAHRRVRIDWQASTSLFQPMTGR